MCSNDVRAAAGSSPVLLDAIAVSRCRRRVHLEHDPNAPERPHQEDAGSAQRMADAQQHRQAVADLLEAGYAEADWVSVPAEASADERVRLTRTALAEGVAVISGALLPADAEGGRRGGCELLVRTAGGYVPVIVVAHRITDRRASASPVYATEIADLDPEHAAWDANRKLRSHPRDQLRIVHVLELLRAAGYAEHGAVRGGVIGLDADVVVWHDLEAPGFPGGLSTVEEYRRRFADRHAVASAAADGDEPLAQPSRVLECRTCPWWQVCEKALVEADDVSLVVRGDDAVELRNAGVATVADLAALDPAAEPPVALKGNSLTNLVALAQAWRAGASVVRKVDTAMVERADIEVDVDMESFSDRGAYLWGALLSGHGIGIREGYHAFATWEPLPSEDEARSFAEFWAWFTDVRSRAASRGLSFRAYCYNARAENRWLFASAERFAGYPGVPDKIGRAHV